MMFAEFDIALFRPDLNVYGGHQDSNSSYEWEDPVAFVTN
jgi:hypothetical protein